MDNTKDTVKEVKGKSFIFRAITPKVLDEASRVRKISYSNALREGALTIEEANKIIDERQILTQKDHELHIKNRLTLAVLEERVTSEDDLEDSKKEEMALEMDELRNALIEYGLKLNEIMSNTAEQISIDESDTYIASKIICGQDGKQLFKTVEDLKVASDKDETLRELVDEAMYFVKGFDKDFEDAYSEVGILKGSGYIKNQLTGQWEKQER